LATGDPDLLPQLVVGLDRDETRQALGDQLEALAGAAGGGLRVLLYLVARHELADRLAVVELGHPRAPFLVRGFVRRESRRGRGRLGADGPVLPLLVRRVRLPQLVGAREVERHAVRSKSVADAAGLEGQSDGFSGSSGESSIAAMAGVFGRRSAPRRTGT